MGIKLTSLNQEEGLDEGRGLAGVRQGLELRTGVPSDVFHPSRIPLASGGAQVSRLRLGHVCESLCD